jgi:hypothetical protein
MEAYIENEVKELVFMRILDHPNHFIHLRRPLITVISSKEEIQKPLSILDSRFHGNDINEIFRDYLKNDNN